MVSERSSRAEPTSGRRRRRGSVAYRHTGTVAECRRRRDLALEGHGALLLRLHLAHVRHRRNIQFGLLLRHLMLLQLLVLLLVLLQNLLLLLVLLVLLRLLVLLMLLLMMVLLLLLLLLLKRRGRTVHDVARVSGAHDAWRVSVEWWWVGARR